MNKLRVLALCLAVSAALLGCTRQVSPEVQQELEQQFHTQSSGESAASTGSSAAVQQSTPSESAPSAPDEPQPVYTQVSFKAVGDNLIHNTIYLQAADRAAEGEEYDFYPAYSRVEPLLEGADLAFINQETLLASQVFEPSSYPMFNSPTQVGDTMLSLGFNLFSHANNHALDKGVKGIEATLDYWDAKIEEGADILVTGIFRNEEDMNTPRIIEKNGITFALVAFTEHTNGLMLPSTSENRIIYTSETELMQQQIEAAQELADVVLVSVHWGVENSHTVTDAQRNLAQQLIDWGADIILGTHPHVLQPIEQLTSTDGKSTGYVIYSLGNFISAQSAGDNLIGGVLSITFEKEQLSGVVTISKPVLTPIVTHYETAWQKNLELYPLSEYTQELAQSHGVVRNTPAFSLEYIHQMLESVIGDEYLDDIPAPAPAQDSQEETDSPQTEQEEAA